ncbi:MAG: DNA repair protein RecO [Candidatus Cloacimonas sp.]
MKNKLRAILVKQSKYSESSLILQFFSREFGHIGVLAKGILKNNEKQQLLPLCEYELIAYEPKEQGLWLFSEAFLIRDFSVYANSATWTAAETCLELVSQLIISQEDIATIYDLTISCLTYLQKVNNNAILIFWRFLNRITILSGIGNPLSYCCLCKKPLSVPIAYLKTKGGLVCEKCLPEINPDNALMILSPPARNILTLLPEIANHLEDIKINRAVVNEINTVFELYWQAHHKQALHLKGLSVLAQFYNA